MRSPVKARSSTQGLPCWSVPGGTASRRLPRGVYVRETGPCRGNDIGRSLGSAAVIGEQLALADVAQGRSVTSGDFEVGHVLVPETEGDGGCSRARLPRHGAPWLLCRGNSIRVMPLDSLPRLISRITAPYSQTPVNRAVSQIRRTYLTREQQVEFVNVPADGNY